MSLCWSLAFYLLEHYDFLIIDTPWAANVLQLALSTAGKTNTPNEVYLVILSGFERLILADKLSRSYPGSVIRTKDEVNVINRVICEFIGPGQPHQPLLAGVMFKVFNEASREHSKMLQDWVLSTLPTFTKRSPI
ncbi:Huntingtinlike, partial [Caligus rogercresseyi]